MSRKRWAEVRPRAWAMHDTLQQTDTQGDKETLATLRVGTAVALLAAATEAAEAAEGGAAKELRRAMAAAEAAEPSFVLLDAAAAAKQRDAAFRHLLKASASASPLEYRSRFASLSRLACL